MKRYKQTTTTIPINCDENVYEFTIYTCRDSSRGGDWTRRSSVEGQAESATPGTRYTLQTPTPPRSHALSPQPGAEERRERVGSGGAAGTKGKIE